MSIETSETEENKVVQEWNVASESTTGIFYKVKKFADDLYACECPHWRYRCSKSGKDCKHISWAKRHPDQAQSSGKINYVFVYYRGNAVKREGDKFFIPLIPLDDRQVPVTATIAYDLLQEGVSISRIRDEFKLPKDWTIKAIENYIAENGRYEKTKATTLT